jgi:excisionase family DNA binding protein
MGRSTEELELPTQRAVPNSLPPPLPRGGGVGASPLAHHEAAPPATAHELMTVPEAARLLRMNPKVLYSLAAAGKVPGVLRLGRSIRVRRAALVGEGAVDSLPVEAQRLTGEPT